MLRIDTEQMRAIEAAAERAYPAECCGLLAGFAEDADALRVSRVVISRNVTTSDARDSFEVDPQVLGDVPVDQRMVGRSVPAHQLHRLPILLAFLLIEREPGKVPQFFRQGGTPLHREL